MTDMQELARIVCGMPKAEPHVHEYAPRQVCGACEEPESHPVSRWTGGGVRNIDPPPQRIDVCSECGQEWIGKEQLICDCGEVSADHGDYVT